MTKTLLLFSAASGAASVILGAFGAHALKSRLESEQLQMFDTAVRYQMFHTLALLAAAWLLSHSDQALLKYSGVAFMTGIVLFSGSLYLLATRSLLGIEGATWLGPVTPLGGLAFVAGWVFMFLGVWKR